MAKSVGKNETLEQRVAQLEVGQSWVSAVVRKIAKELKEHFGIDAKDGKMHIGLMVFIMLAGLAVAGTTTVVDWSTGVSDPIGTAKITTDGTDATLTINKIVGLYTGTITNFTVTGRLAVTGATTNTGAQTFIGATTVNNLTVSTNASVGGTLLVTGVATLTAKPALNAALTAAGTLTNGPLNVLPAGTSNTNGVWISISHNGTNMVIRAFPQ